MNSQPAATAANQRFEPCLDILNGSGHMRISLINPTPAEIEHAKSVIEDMLRKGYTITLETEAGKTHRVKTFNRHKGTYVIDTRGEPKQEVPITTAKATAFAHTGGG